MSYLSILDPEATPPQSLIPDEQTALDALIKAKGNVPLTCERLQCTQVELIAALRDRHSDLKEYMEVLATLELFSMLPLITENMKAQLSQLEPGESVRAYMDMMKLIKAQEVNVNIGEQAFRRVPRSLQELWIEQEAERERLEA